MPDKFGFDHLGPHHRCIWCEWPGHGVSVSEADRARHARQHERQRKSEIQKQREANLREARRLKRQAERENKAIEERRSA